MGKTTSLRLSCVNSYGTGRQFNVYFTEAIFEDLEWLDDLKKGHLFCSVEMPFEMPNVLIIRKEAYNALPSVHKVKVLNAHKGLETNFTSCSINVGFNTWFGPDKNFELFNATPVSFTIKQTRGHKAMFVNIEGVVRAATPRARGNSRQSFNVPAAQSVEENHLPPIKDVMFWLNQHLELFHMSDELSDLKIGTSSTGAQKARLERLAVYE